MSSIPSYELNSQATLEGRARQSLKTWGLLDFQKVSPENLSRREEPLEPLFNRI
ncbi:MAG: hypothetical protein K0S07_224 [Chlamydiales bacterium]|jgi:energy-coupling factor transporter ATP-binding protein EcfA2|nr:hypothetical protein [Chlamydiales bacterium]